MSTAPVYRTGSGLGLSLFAIVSLSSQSIVHGGHNVYGQLYVIKSTRYDAMHEFDGELNLVVWPSGLKPPYLNSAKIFCTRSGTKLPNLKIVNISSYTVICNSVIHDQCLGKYLQATIELCSY